MNAKARTRDPRAAAADRPFVFLNVAATADGKLAPASRRFAAFSSARDQQLLHELRTRADAVMAGARTVDSAPVTMGPGGRRYRELRRKRGLAEYNLRVIVSGSASINPRAEIFCHTFSPLIILVTEQAPKARIQRLEKLGAIVHLCGEREIDFTTALPWLRREWNVRRLLCEGGGEINDALLQADLVDDIYVTLCPVIFGGRTAPTLSDGLGVASLACARPLRRRSARRVGPEMYLHYCVLR